VPRSEDAISARAVQQRSVESYDVSVLRERRRKVISGALVPGFKALPV